MVQLAGVVKEGCAGTAVGGQAGGGGTPLGVPGPYKLVSIAGGDFFMKGAMVGAGAGGTTEGALGAVATDAIGISSAVGAGTGSWGSLTSSRMGGAGGAAG